MAGGLPTNNHASSMELGVDFMDHMGRWALGLIELLQSHRSKFGSYVPTISIVIHHGDVCAGTEKEG